MANEEKVEPEVKKEEVKAEAKTESAKAKPVAAKSEKSSSSAPARPPRPDTRERRPQQRKPYRRFFRRRQKQMVPSYVDWKDVDYLRRFVPERGKIMPRRISGVSAKDQRRVARAIKRARTMALLPYVGD